MPYRYQGTLLLLFAVILSLAQRLSCGGAKEIVVDLARSAIPNGFACYISPSLFFFPFSH